MKKAFLIIILLLIFISPCYAIKIISAGHIDGTLPSIQVRLIGNGTGNITGGSINCPLVNCYHEYQNNSGMIILTATPNTGSTFLGWSGAGCSGTGTCNINIVNSSSTQYFPIANFIISQTTFPSLLFTFNMDKAGDGNIKIASDNNNLYTLEPTLTPLYNGGRIFKWDYNGNFISQIVNDSTRDFCSISVYNGYIYVVDSNNNVICKYDTSGNLISTGITGPSPDGGIFANSNGVFFFDGNNYVVKKYDLNLNLIKTISSITQGAFGAFSITGNNKYLYVLANDGIGTGNMLVLDYNLNIIDDNEMLGQGVLWSITATNTNIYSSSYTLFNGQSQTEKYDLNYNLIIISTSYPYGNLSTDNSRLYLSNAYENLVLVFAQ